MKLSWQIVRSFCTKAKRKYIVAEEVRKQNVEDYTHVTTNSYSFLLEKDLPYTQLYQHCSDTPSNLLKRDAIHIFQEKMNYRAIQEKYNAYLKKQITQYEKAFQKCSTPSDVFYLERRIKSQIKHKNKKIGMIEGKYKHYRLFKSLDEIRSLKTAQQYEKKGVCVKAIGNQVIYPMGKVWMPTNEAYLQPFTSFLDHYGKNVNTALDIGCGSGILSYIIGRKYKKCKIVGVDKNPDAIETCLRNYPSLQIQNFKPLNFDIVQQKEEYLANKLKEEKCQQKFDLIVCNPPWVVAKKMANESSLSDGVYDENGNFLKKCIEIASKYLKSEESRFLLIYSDLSQILGLQKEKVEEICEKHKMLIHSKRERPFLQNLNSSSALSMYKQKAKIIVYEIGKA